MIDTPLMNDINEAAAQGKTSLHEEKACGTCGGTGLVTEWVEDIPACHVECHVCNGTGKENAK